MRRDVPTIPRWLTTAVGAVLIWSNLPAFGIDYDDFARTCDDPSMPGVQRVEKLYRLLVEEIKAPTAPYRSESGGEINHEYILWNITVALWHAIEDSPVARKSLLRKMSNEKMALAKQVVQIALGMAGEKSVMKEVTTVVRSGEHTLLREQAVVAIKLTLRTMAIPVLIEALQGPAAPTAARCLDDIGVKIIERSANGVKCYAVDEPSAVNALTPELQNKDKEHVKQAIEAIARVGGPAAKEELKRFIEGQERLPGKSDVVAKAKEALARLEADKK